MEEKTSENLIELMNILGEIDVTPDRIAQNSAYMQDNDGSIIEY